MLDGPRHPYPCRLHDGICAKDCHESHVCLAHRARCGELMERYICIHGHFYQPPRENAWLEFVELQDSAYPFHDWNERITAECYAPNGMSRILDGRSDVEQIVNNYARISFNFGPTLLAWMAEKEPEAYRTIQGADKESQNYFGGHGSAIAQS